jgi:hypothetical protein
MRGYLAQPDSNRYTADKWEGKLVAENGTTRKGIVVRAFWQGNNEPVQLYVVFGDEDGTELIDTEHVTMVKP